MVTVRGNVRGDLGLVGDHEDRGAEVVAEPVDQLEHVVAVLVAELAGRLVGEQQLRRAGDAQASASRCRWPPDIVETTWSACCSRPTRRSSSASSRAPRRSAE